MNNVVYKRKEKSFPFNENNNNKEKYRTTSIKNDEKKNSYEKFNSKITKKNKPEIEKEKEFKIENFIDREKIRPKTFDVQKKINFQSDNIYKNSNYRSKITSNNKRTFKSKPSYAEKIHNFKENNLMKFKKKTNLNAFEDLLPFNDIHKIPLKDTNYREFNAQSNSRGKFNINYADMRSFIVNGLEIENKKKVGL